MKRAALAALLLAACAEAGTGVDTAAEGGAPPADSGSPDAATPIDSGVTGGGCGIVVNEVRTGVSGAPDDDFVEVYNTCASTFPLEGFKLVFRLGSNTAPVDPSNDTLLYAWPKGATIAPRAFQVFAGAGFSGAKDGALGDNLKDNLGAVGIRDAQGGLVDSVGYGRGAIDEKNAFIERAPAPAHAIAAPPGSSIVRFPDGKDTNDNSVDFRNSTSPTPGKPNQ